jgi:hypothetical protein
VSTPEHPYFVKNRGWILAKDLRAGDILLNVNGQEVVVEQVQHEILENPITVYNFEVKDYHTYFVAENVFADAESFILVHNSCNHKSAWAKERRTYWKSEAKNPNTIFKGDNLNRIQKGLAPIGSDGYSIVLHHTEGIAKNFYAYQAMTRTEHIALHRVIGYFL